MIPGLRRQKQKALEFYVVLGYRVSARLEYGLRNKIPSLQSKAGDGVKFSY